MVFHHKNDYILIKSNYYIGRNKFISTDLYYFSSISHLDFNYFIFRF